MTFEDIRQMDDKKLAKWLEKIWKTGFVIGKLKTHGDPQKLCPDFYDKLREQ